MKTLNKISSVIVMLSMVFGLFASPLITTSAVVKAQESEPTPTLTPILIIEEPIEPTVAPEVPTDIPLDPTVLPEEPTLIPEEPTLIPVEPSPTLEPTQTPIDPTITPTLFETASVTPTFTETITTTPTSTELPEIVPLFTSESSQALTGKYIVVYKTTDADIESSVMASDMIEVSAMGAQVEQIYTSSIKGFSASLSPEALKKLRQNPEIDFIEQDEIVSVSDEGITPEGVLSTQNASAYWNLDRIDQPYLPLNNTYNYYQNGSGVHVYVIDTGIYTGHPDFGGRASMDANFAEAGPGDCNGHGTHVAGTVGSTTYGVAKGVSLHGVRVLNCSGVGSKASIIAGIDWVTKNHIKPAVANMSLGGNPSAAEDMAVNAGIAAGITFVVAAGNEATNACTFSPSRVPAAITVGASDITDSVTSFSNVGSCLDIFAPGEDIFSTSNSGGFYDDDGTSMASPHVAGATALILQSNPSASPANVYATLIANSTKDVMNANFGGSPDRLLNTRATVLNDPVAPILLYPTNGAVSNNQRPPLTWKKTATADSYLVEIASDSGFSTIVKQSITGELTYTSDSDLPIGTYYWHVQASNTEITSIGSPWSNTFTFTVDLTAPDAPVLLQPLEGATPVGIPTFSWGPVTGANAYQFEFDDDSDFSSPIFNSPDGTVAGQPAIATTSYKPSGMLTQMLYYWHVRARDASGNWGGWSSSRTLIVQVSVPTAPGLISPVSGSSTSSNPTLVWGNVAGGVVYQVQVSDTNTFTGTLLENQTKSVGEFSHAITPVLTDGTWYWRVRAFNSTQGAGLWSVVGNFLYDTIEPGAPTLTSPLNAATPLGTPSFTWLAVASAIKYQFEFGTSVDAGTTIVPVFTSPDGTVAGQPAITVLTYKPGTMSAGSPLYWHVRACDAAGNWSDWSTPRSLIIQAALPGIPVLTSPVTNLITQTLPVLNWNSAVGGVSYQVQLSTSSTFTGSPIIYDAGGALSYTLTTPFTDGTWYWRVRAINISGGTGNWSTSRIFIYDTLVPAAPTLKAPAPEVLVRTTPAFSWNALAGTNAYQFEYGTSTDGTIATFSSVHLSPILTTLTYTPPAMALGGFYWHVKAKDIAGNWGEWGELRKVNLYAPILAAPTSMTPATGVIINTKTPTFNWVNGNGAKAYSFHLSDSPTFTSGSPISLPAGVVTFTPPDNSYLPHEGTWYWRVASVNASDEVGPYSTTRSILLDTTAPDAPGLIAPVNNAPNVRVIPSFSWTAVAGAIVYQFQIDDDNFADPIYFSTPGDTVPGTPITTKIYKPDYLATNTPYSWRVRARDAANNWGVWSATRTLTLLPGIPVAPVLTSPNLSALINDATPDFTWNAVYAGNTYRIQINDASTFLPPEIDQVLGVGVTTFTPATDLADGIYYWRAQAININVESGAFSTTRSFTIDTSAPAAPVLTAPINNAPSVRAVPIFSWKTVVSATAYQFRIDDNSDFGSLVETSPVLTKPNFKPTAILTIMTPYYWQVQSRDAAGNWGDWSAYNTLTILPAIPAAPVLSSTTPASLTNDNTPTFSWNSVPAGETYHIQVDNTSNFSSVFEIDEPLGSGILTFTPSTTLADGIYYWRVQASNANSEAGVFSATRSFTIDTSVPAAPGLTAPINNAPLIRADPTFTWATVLGGNAYEFQIDESTGFGDPLFTSPVLTVASYKPVVALTVMTPYYWRVRARDAAGNWGAWSTYNTLTLLPAIPAAPTLSTSSPVPLTNDNTPTFNWNSVPTGDRYRIQVSNTSAFSPTLEIDELLNSGILTFTPATSLADGIHYWRVQARNVNAEFGPFSTAIKFTIDSSAPAAPVLKTPINNAPLIRAVPTFTWSTVTGANAYRLQIDESTGFGDPLFTSPVLTVASYKPVVSLTVMTPYYWHVQSRDAAGNWGDWSAYNTIRILPSVPAAPVLMSPATDYLTKDNTPTFTWNSVVAGDTYRIQVANTSTFTPTLEIDEPLGVGILAYTPSTGLPDGIYYWRVQATNVNVESGPFSAGKKFTIDTTAPAVPELTAPMEGTTLPPGTPTFAWVASTGAKIYQFEYDNNSDFGTPIFTSPDGSIPGLAAIAATSFNPPAMAPAVPYYWRVRAGDAAGNWSGWSTSRTVVVQAPLPGIPTLKTPAVNAFTLDHQLVFSWASVLNGYTFQIQVSDSTTFASIVLNAETASSSEFSYTPTTYLPLGNLFWRVRAKNVNGVPGAWSAARAFSIGYTSEFDVNYSGWNVNPGAAWSINSGNLTTAGENTALYTSSVRNNARYSSFAFETRMKMDFDTTSSLEGLYNMYGIFLTDSLSFDSYNDITNGYYFYIDQYKFYDYDEEEYYYLSEPGIIRIQNGVWYSVGNVGYITSVGAYNTLKVVTESTSLVFYTNNIKIGSIGNSSLKSWNMGLFSAKYRGANTTTFIERASVFSPFEAPSFLSNKANAPVVFPSNPNHIGSGDFRK